MATTRHGQKGIGVRPYAGFSPKTPALPKGTGQFTRLLSIGIGGRRRLASSKGIGPFTRLTSMGINGRRVEFVAKKPAGGGKGEGQFTRLLTYAIGGKRVVFVAKSPADTDSTLGGAPKYTDEQLKAMDDFGRIQMGLPTKEQEESQEISEEIIIPDIPEISILPDKEITLDLPESELVQLSQVRQESFEPTLQEKISEEDDIGLILAIITAHEN